jgi:hypothetical protein
VNATSVRSRQKARGVHLSYEDSSTVTPAVLRGTARSDRLDDKEQRPIQVLARFRNLGDERRVPSEIPAADDLKTGVIHIGEIVGHRVALGPKAILEHP